MLSHREEKQVTRNNNNNNKKTTKKNGKFVAISHLFVIAGTVNGTLFTILSLSLCLLIAKSIIVDIYK